MFADLPEPYKVIYKYLSLQNNFNQLMEIEFFH